MKQKTSPIDQEYIDEHGNKITLGTTDMDAFFAGSAPAVMAAGHHVVRLAHWELVPEKEVETRTDRYTTKPYILLDLVDVEDGDVTTTRLYSGFVPYFMNALLGQFNGEIRGMKLTEILTYMGTHEFEIWVSYSAKDGARVDYREPRK